MIKVIRNLCCVITAVVFIVSLTLCCTYCFNSINQISIGLASGESVIKVSVELNMYEKNLDENKPIPNTLFYLFKSTGEQIGSQYFTDESGKVNIELTKGEYYFQEITPSIGYTFDEVDGEKITKYYFNVNGKNNEEVIVNAYNIRLKGSITISKVVKNLNDEILTEEQLNTDFIFNVKFSDNGEYKFKIDNKEEQVLKKDETIKLKHGETAVFETIPVGVSYVIKEELKEGYIYNSSNHQGTITNDGINVVFTNTYDPNFIPSTETIKLIVTKKLEGEYLITEEKKEFNFKMIIDDEETNFSLKKDETKEFEIFKGSTYEVIEENYFEEGYKQEIINSSGVAYDEDINVIATNTYIGDIKKIINGRKTWVLNNQNISLPESIIVKIKKANIVVEEKQVMPNSNGEWLYEFIVSKYDDNDEEIIYEIEENLINGFIATYNGYDITNTYIAPIEVEIPTVYKEINTEDYIETEFEFMLTGKNMPMPEGAEDSSKIITITGEGNINFGKIIFENPGVYTYTIKELNGGIKGWTYDNKIHTIEVQIIENNGQLEASIRCNDNVDGCSNIVFINSFDESMSGININISGTIIWHHGNNPKDKYPSSVIISVYGNDELVIQKQITNKDNWNFSFDLPKYDENGNKINYTINQDDIDNYTKTINGYNIINSFINIDTSNNPETQDHISIWLILMIVSGLIISVFIFSWLKNKKKKNKK